LARALDLSFQRIQFTSDLLPSDVIGLSIYNQRDARFEWNAGPIFSNIVLADEINRATPKTQSALLEAMAEEQITVEGVSRPLPLPFMVVATQNPTEHHGTYLLNIVAQTRANDALELGISPRGTLSLFRAAQAVALIENRDFCIADDIKRLILPVFAHRIIVNSRQTASGKRRSYEAEQILRDILQRTNVPL